MGAARAEKAPPIEEKRLVAYFLIYLVVGLLFVFVITISTIVLDIMMLIDLSSLPSLELLLYIICGVSGAATIMIRLAKKSII